MADLVIRGMNMPKTCAHCDLKRYDQERIWTDNGTELLGAWVCKRTDEIIWNTQRGKNCPLFLLPERYGRLVDLDALINELYNLLDKREKDAAFCGNMGPSVTWDDAIDCIKAARIIIPAEGGTDDDGNA